MQVGRVEAGDAMRRAGEHLDVRRSFTPHAGNVVEPIGPCMRCQRKVDA
jgi:hypothetical protein